MTLTWAVPLMFTLYNYTNLIRYVFLPYDSLK